jgi:PhnB protein
MVHPEQGPAGGLTPHLTIRDRRGGEAIEFYRRAFAAESAMEPMLAEDGARIMHAHLRVNGGSVMLADDWPEMRGGVASPPPASVTLHLQVDDADAWFERAIEAGATATMPPQDMFWGDRYAQLRDPFGHSWAIGARIEGDKR